MNLKNLKICRQPRIQTFVFKCIGTHFVCNFQTLRIRLRISKFACNWELRLSFNTWVGILRIFAQIGTGLTQWWSKIQTCPNSEWLMFVWFSNGQDFKWFGDHLVFTIQIIDFLSRFQGLVLGRHFIKTMLKPDKMAIVLSKCPFFWMVLPFTIQSFKNSGFWMFPDFESPLYFALFCPYCNTLLLPAPIVAKLFRRACKP